MYNTDQFGGAILDLLSKVAPTTKIVSISTRPVNGIVGDNGAGLPFVVVQSAGNGERESFFNPADDFDGEPALLAQKQNILGAIAADKVLYIAGYTVDEENGYVRDSGSTGCTGVEDGCLYAPMDFDIPDDDGFSGTSASAPSVASALASVLALFPDTEGTDLIRLAKACAIREDNLVGLGRADFGCMTVMDENGQWRVVTQCEFNTIVSPVNMVNTSFPGRTKIIGTFTKANSDETVRLGVTHLGTFDFVSGVPIGTTNQATTGFFPIGGGDENNNAVGIGYAGENGTFSRITFGQRNEFFGLGWQHGYTDSTAVDADVGHRNIFARVSWRKAHGTRVQNAEGASFGITVRETLAVSEKTDVTVAANTDRFLGGSADTVFGPVTMEKSPWNKTLESSFQHTPNKNTELALRGSLNWYGNGTEDTRITATYRLRF